jgi:peptidase C13-like protein
MNEIPLSTGERRHGWLAVLVRLWLLARVKSLPAAGATRAIVIMAAVWLSLWVGIDHWQSQPDPLFTTAGIPLLPWYALAILGLAALLRWRARPAPFFGPTFALAMGAVPVPLLFTGVIAPYLDSQWLLVAGAVVAVYVLLYLARGLHALTGESQRAAACAGLAFLIAFSWLTDALDVIPDVWSPQETQTTDSGEGTADGEALLFSQAGRIDESLSAVTRDASPKPQAFFLGFAGVGEQKVFAQEIGLASRVLGERYGIDGRGISLINDERDVERAPLASVSGLKYALQGLASRMNRDRDVLFLSISSHGSQDPAIVVSNSQLPLKDLTGADLADALRDSGIRWRVIIISACYAGGFIEPLRDPQTIIITAAAADRTSFGCSNDSDLTYFGEAFYRDALPGARSLRVAFDAAKTAIAARESREHVEASNPQAYFGAKIEAKLAATDPGEPPP